MAGYRKEIAVDLSKNKWYVSWFFLSIAILDIFKGSSRNTARTYRNGTNLCTFVRVLLLWTPLVIVLNVASYAAMIGVVTVLPVILFGFGGYVLMILCLALALGVLVLAVSIPDWIDEIKSHLRHKRYLARLAREDAGEDVAPQPQAKKEPRFLDIVWQYAVAVKHRICPTITFQD